MELLVLADLPKVRSDHRVEARNATEQTDRTRHMMASMKVSLARAALWAEGSM